MQISEDNSQILEIRESSNLVAKCEENNFAIDLTHNEHSDDE